MVLEELSMEKYQSKLCGLNAEHSSLCGNTQDYYFFSVPLCFSVYII